MELQQNTQRPNPNREILFLWMREDTRNIYFD